MVRLPQNSSSKNVNSDPDMKRIEQGFLGQFFGDHAPVYLAALLGLVSLVGAIIAAFSSAAHAPDIAKGLLAITVSCITFIGGSQVARK